MKKRQRGTCGICHRRYRLTKKGRLLKHVVKRWHCKGSGLTPIPLERAADLSKRIGMGRPFVDGPNAVILITLQEAEKLLKIRAEYAAQVTRINEALKAKKFPTEVPHPLGG